MSLLEPPIAQHLRSFHPYWALLPLGLIVFLALVLWTLGVNDAASYIAIQQSIFYPINQAWAPFPAWVDNLTQLGDALILMALATVYFKKAPQLWQGLSAALLISLLFSSILKPLLAVPRPAAAFPIDSFHIVGPTLTGHNSLPSGHAMTAFVVLTTLAILAAPAAGWRKNAWRLGCFGLGTLIALTRVGAGAHYPLDITFGSLLGILAACLGIFLTQNGRWMLWMAKPKYQPIWALFCGAFVVALVQKWMQNPLPVFLLAAAASLWSGLQIIRAYVSQKSQ